jgi:single-stranded-DNA-specific exonuclease
LVAQGLKVMARRDNMGMAALIDASRLTRAPLCSDLGFALGPRINAGGRVGESDAGRAAADHARTTTKRAPSPPSSTVSTRNAAPSRRTVQEAAERSPNASTTAPCCWWPGAAGILA